MLILDHPEYGHIQIQKPEVTQDGQNYTCVLLVNGIGGPVFGVTPLDALENAVRGARGFAPIRDDDPTGWKVS